MELGYSLELAEQSLISQLQSKQAGIDDRTGKGSATETVVAEQLLIPQLPAGMRVSKGAVTSADNPSASSPAIDRIIHDSDLAPPLVHSSGHSVFPIEAVIGLVEVTMRLDATKLREDIERMAAVKAMRKRRYLIPVPGTVTQSNAATVETLSPRSFVVGLPADTNWKAQTIADSLRSIQIDFGPPTHIHGLYVIGVGFLKRFLSNTRRNQCIGFAPGLAPTECFALRAHFGAALTGGPRCHLDGQSISMITSMGVLPFLRSRRCGLTPRCSARVGDKVPSLNCLSRGAQLNR